MRWGLPLTLFRRLPMVAAGVMGCYLFDWDSLRHLTSEITFAFAEWRGLSPYRLADDLIGWNRNVFQFGISCTFADVFCGAVPLVWVSRLSAPRNFLNLLALALALFAFNAIRLCLTDVAFGAGLPWLIADEVIGGLAYFLVWISLVHWLERHELAAKRSGAAAFG